MVMRIALTFKKKYVEKPLKIL